MKRMVIITEISVVLLLMLLALSGCGSRREKADETITGPAAGEADGQSGAADGLSGEADGLSGEAAGQSDASAGLSDAQSGQNTADTQSSPDTDEVPLSLDALQGHWVDVNGDTTLDFTGNQMTVRWGSYEDLYTVGVTGTDRYGTVFNAKDRNLMFEMMSELIWRSGVLTAGEMVLDAEGHSYRFVREDALASELAIVDDSRDMLKEITSEDLTEFHLTFSLEDTWFDVPADADWQAGQYSINVERGESGAYLLSFDISGESYIIQQYRSEVGEEFVKGLAQLIREQEIPEKNGYYLHNSTSVHSWSLLAEYESGEELLLMAEGDAALECPFSIRRFLEYVSGAVEQSP
ncbi:MAG: hypothetical protein IJ100_08395 [Lachnospiraceae bacterium]|nr:hypothetical protein [Lachnospiraceae bacterium]